MSEVLGELLAEEGPIAVVRVFGLDQVLTDQDDPQLWAAVLAKHWRAPTDPEIIVEGLKFGVGRIVYNEDGSSKISGPSGMEKIGEWCFEREDAGHLCLAECQPIVTTGMMMMAMMEGRNLLEETYSPSTVSDKLEVSRPSVGESRALVYVGMSAPFVGHGETIYWERKETGEWHETEEVFSSWFT